jgi:hypothetical protein
VRCGGGTTRGGGGLDVSLCVFVSHSSLVSQWPERRLSMVVAATGTPSPVVVFASGGGGGPGACVAAMMKWWRGGGGPAAVGHDGRPMGPRCGVLLFLFFL